MAAKRAAPIVNQAAVDKAGEIREALIKAGKLSPIDDPAAFPPEPEDLPSAGLEFAVPDSTLGAPPKPPTQRQSAARSDNVAAPRATPGAAAPSKISQVINPQEQVKLYFVDDRGSEKFVNDYTAREIGAGGGNMEGFIRQWIAPTYGGGGVFRAYKQTRSGPSMIAEIRIARPDGQPIGPAAGWGTGAPGPQAPNPLGDQANAFSQLMTSINSTRTEARAEANAAQEAEDRKMQTLVTMMGGKKENGGGNDFMQMMLAMKMLGGDDGAKAASMNLERQLDALSTGLGNAFGELDKKLTMGAMNQAPLPPLPPVTDWAAVLTAASAVLAPVVTPLMSIATREAPKPRDVGEYIPLLASAMVILKEAGMVGGDKVTQTDVELAKIGAKLEASGTAKGPLDQLKDLLEVQAMMTPQGDGWIAVVDKAIDRLPDLAKEMNEGSRIKTEAHKRGQGARKKIKRADGKKVDVPEALVHFRNDIAELDLEATYNGEVINRKGEEVSGKIVLVAMMIYTGAALGQEKDPWKEWIDTFSEATCREETKEALDAMAKILYRAFGKGDKKAVSVYRKVEKVWTEGVLLIGAYFRNLLKRDDLAPDADGKNVGGAADEELEEEVEEEEEVDERLDERLDPDDDDFEEAVADAFAADEAEVEADEAEVADEGIVPSTDDAGELVTDDVDLDDLL